MIPQTDLLHATPALLANLRASKTDPVSAWEAALKAGGHPDFTLRILARANHSQWEAKVGSNAEMASLQRFVPEYFTTIQDCSRNGFEASAQPCRGSSSSHHCAVTSRRKLASTHTSAPSSRRHDAMVVDDIAFLADDPPLV